MSGRSFIDRAAEERRKRLVVGGIGRFGPSPLIGLELVEHGVHSLVGIGGLALPLHRVEVVHIGLVGLFIVAEQTHRTSRFQKLIRRLWAPERNGSGYQ